MSTSLRKHLLSSAPFYPQPRTKNWQWVFGTSSSSFGQTIGRILFSKTFLLKLSGDSSNCSTLTSEFLERNAFSWKPKSGHFLHLLSEVILINIYLFIYLKFVIELIIISNNFIVINNLNTLHHSNYNVLFLQ
jgi:hypothetical protein